MFTGIVEELGSVIDRTGSRLRIGASLVLDGIKLGDSTAVNGCCLTVVDFDAAAGWWDADVSDETYSRTSLGDLATGDAVNLERPVRLSDRLGGHLVQGHVDAVGVVTEPVPELTVRVPPTLLRYIVEKGSITVDGVSLTVNEVADQPDGSCHFAVNIIPHTAEVTTLGTLQQGDTVNLEIDVLARYLQRMQSLRG